MKTVSVAAGQYVLELLNEKGYSDKGIHRETGISAETLRNIRRAYSATMRKSTFERLCLVLGYTPDVSAAVEEVQVSFAQLSAYLDTNEARDFIENCRRPLKYRAVA